MANPFSRDPGIGDTVRGALLIVVAGAALGVAFNALGLASRPPHGLAWIKPVETLESLESLQANAAPERAERVVPGARGPMDPSTGGAKGTLSSPSSTGGVPAPSAASARAAGAPAGDAAKPPAAASAGRASNGSSSGVEPAAVRTPPAVPAATPPASAPAAPASAPAPDLPPVPESDKPIKIGIDLLKRYYDAGAVLIVDAREASEYEEGHIAGAILLPYNDALIEPERMDRLGEAGRPIVAYCSGGTCELSIDLARALIERGKRRVLVYEGGYPEWAAAGHPVAMGGSPR
jgi:rhodanese-related sulfurtransferase